MKLYRFSEPYSKAFRCALVWQMIGILIALPGQGGMLIGFLFLSIIYWILAPLISFFRKKPTKIEIFILSAGPFSLVPFLLFLMLLF